MAAAPAASPLLEAFYGLSSLVEDERKRAALSILKQVSASQQAFEESTAKMGTGASIAISGALCNDLSYATRRLVRGVASSRDASRQGFSLGLTELLAAFPAVATGDVLDQLMEATAFSQKSSKQEQRDGILGRVFGLLAITRAGRFAEEEVEADAALGPRLATTVTELFRLAGKKSWVADVTFEAIAAVVASAGPSAWAAHLSPVVLGQLAGDTRDWSAEQLSLALALEETLLSWFPAGAEELALPPAIAAMRKGLEPSVLQRYHLTAPALALKANGRLSSSAGGGGDSDDEDGDDDKDGGHNDVNGGVPDEDTLPENAPLAGPLLSSTGGYPRLHSVWGRLLQRFHASVLTPPNSSSSSSSSEAERSAGLASFAQVWRVYVDEVLVPAGPERKATAMLLLQTLLPSLASNPPALGAVLSQHLTRTLIRSAGDKKKALHAPAVALLTALTDVCRGKPAAASAAVLCLLARGHPNFDRQTHTQTIATLLSYLDDVSVLAHVTAAQQEFAQPSDGAVYADIASTVTGISAAKLGLTSAAGGAKGKKKGGGDDDDGSDAAGGSDAEDDDEDEDEEDGAARAGKLTPSDVRRLWALDTLTSALRNPALKPLRSADVIRRITAFLAVHAYADVSIPEPVMSALAKGSASASDSSSASAASTGSSSSSSGKDKSSKKRKRDDPAAASAGAIRGFMTSAGLIGASASGEEAAAAAGLLVANPPLSPSLRREVRSRLVTLVKDLASAQLAPPPEQLQKQAQKQQQKQTQQQQQSKGGKQKQQQQPDPSAATAAAPAPRVEPWNGIRDRQAAASALTLELTSLVNGVWTAAAAAGEALSASSAGGAASEEGDADAPSIAPVPSVEALAVLLSTSDDDEDSDSDDDSEEEAPSGPSPASVRSRALQLAAFLQQSGTLLLAANAAPSSSTSGSGGGPRYSDAARQCLSVGALLTHTCLHMLGEAGTDVSGSNNGSSGVADVASALSDIIQSLRPLLAPTAALAEKVATSPPPSSAPASADSAGTAPKSAKKPAKGSKAAGKAASAESDAATGSIVTVSSSPELKAASSTLRSLTAPLATGDDEEEKNAEEEATADDASHAILVAVDALLSLLSNASAPLREAVKGGAKALFGCALTSACVDTMLAVVVSKEGEEDESEVDSDDDEDEEDGSDHEGHAHGKKTAAAASGKGKKPFPAAEEDGDDDDESITLEAGALFGTEGDDVSASAAATKGSKAKKKDDSDSDSDSDSDEEGDDAFAASEGAAEAEAEMRRYDAMLSDMLRMRKAGRAAEKQGRQRAAHFRFRALDLLEVAVARLTANNNSAAANASLALALPLPMLQALKTLAARAKGGKESGASGGKKKGGGSAAADAAESAARLYERLAGLLTRLIKGVKVPLLPVEAPQADVSSSKRATRSKAAPSSSSSASPAASSCVTRTSQLAALDSVVALVQEAPSAAFAEACAAVAGLILRSLRAPSQPQAQSKDKSAQQQAASPAATQPAGEHLDRMTSAYSVALTSYLTDKHARVSPSFFRHVLANTPALAARLLPVIATAISTGAVAKPFRVAEAAGLALTGLKTASAPWAAGLPCVVTAPAPAPKSAGRKRTLSQSSLAEASAAPAAGPTVVTVADYLPSALTSLLGAVAAVFDSAAVAAPEGSASDVRRPPALNPKQLREPLALLQHVVKHKMIPAAGAPEALVSAYAAVLTSVAALAGATSSSKLAGSLNALLTSVGREAVELSPAASGMGGASAGAANGGGDDDDEDDGNEDAMTGGAGAGSAETKRRKERREKKRQKEAAAAKKKEGGAAAEASSKPAQQQAKKPAAEGEKKTKEKKAGGKPKPTEGGGAPQQKKAKLQQ